MSLNVNFEMPAQSQFNAQLSCSEKNHTVSVLIDSVADANLMDMALASKLGIRQVVLEKPIHTTALDGRLL